MQVACQITIHADNRPARACDDLYLHPSFAYAPWMMAPVGMIIFTVLAFNAFGDGIRDAVDPYAISK